MYFCLYTPDLLFSNVVCPSLNVRNINCALVFMLHRLCLRAVVKGFLLMKDILYFAEYMSTFSLTSKNPFWAQMFKSVCTGFVYKTCKDCKVGLVFFFPFCFHGLLDLIIRKNCQTGYILLKTETSG